MKHNKAEDQLNPYFALHRGYKVMYNDIIDRAPYTLSAIEALRNKGEIVGQYTLPDVDGNTDVQLWMPRQVAEREEAVALRLEKVRAELKAIQEGREFDRSVYDPRRPAPEATPKPYVPGGVFEMEPGIEYQLQSDK